MIPKKLITVWINDDPVLPPIVEKCIATQMAMAEKMGWGYFFIDYHSCIVQHSFIGESYLRGCLDNGKWVKAADNIRMKELYGGGGVFLDADTELLKPIPEEWLTYEMFVTQEKCGLYANGIVGAEAGSPVIEEYLRRVEDNYKGSGDLIYEPGIRTFTDVVWENIFKKGNKRILVLPAETFHHPDKVIPPEAIGHHHMMKSWTRDIFK